MLGLRYLGQVHRVPACLAWGPCGSQGRSGGPLAHVHVSRPGEARQGPQGVKVAARTIKGEPNNSSAQPTITKEGREKKTHTRNTAEKFRGKATA